ncbi:MAG: hypothetical protein HY764_01125 [Candidatus Portnoybacteria bacterium]|nr:hypothetical protein [Candidatus Portnoybacteria bacterium]
MTQNAEVLKKNIITELGLDNLPEERKLELLGKMSDLIQKRVLLRVIKSLSLDDKEQFDKLLGQENEQEIYRFLISKVPNIDEITDEEVIRFKEEVIEHVKKLNF